MRYYPECWRDTPPIVINPAPVRPEIKDHIYGEVIARRDTFVIRHDGEVFSAYDNERMILATRDKDRVRKFIEWVK